MEEKNSSSSLIVGVILLLLVAVGIYFLFLKDSPKDEEKGRDTVTLQLKWIEQAQFMGFLVARELGYYEDENDALDELHRPGFADKLDALVNDIGNEGKLYQHA